MLKVETSADDGNKGDNMLNPDEARWSCKGKDCTAIFDPGGIQDVNQFVIRFPKDAERTEKDGFDYGCESQRTEQGCKAIRLGSDNRYSLFRSK